MGLGSGGHRTLAFVFAGLGLLGLLVIVLAGGLAGAAWLGLVLAAASLLALTGSLLSTLGLGAGFSAAARPNPAGAAPDGEGPVPLPTPEPPAISDPDADIGFEYTDGETAPAPVAAPAPAPVVTAVPAPAPISSRWDEPEFEPAPMPMAVSRGPGPRSLPPPPPKPAARTPPPPMARPRATSAPPSGKSAADSAGWPQRKGKAGVTRRQLAERHLPRDPGPAVEVEGPGPVRREPPIVMARTVASAEATGIPEGSGIGKCGNCGVLLLAPKKRPIRLQCPRCERVHLLP